MTDATVNSMQKRSVQLCHDAQADAAYVYLVEHIQPGEVRRTVPVEAPGIDGSVNIDLDTDGRILGFEILSAERMLRAN